MESIKLIIVGIARGLCDSLWGTAAIFYLDKPPEQSRKTYSSATTTLAKRRAQMAQKPKVKNDEPKVLSRVFQCCALNGGIFVFSIEIFYQVLMPLLQLLMDHIFGHTPGMSSFVWSWLGPLLAYTFSALWVLPLFLLSKIVNCLWFQDIAEAAYRHVRGRPQLLPSISKLIADILFSVLIQALFLLQGMLMSLIPIGFVGKLASLLHLCLLYSLYAFEYRWFNMGWELHKRLSYIEHNWPYFFGFGLPLAVVTALPSSYMMSGGLFSILFPFFIVSGNEAELSNIACEFPLRLFSPVVCASNAIFHKTVCPPDKRNLSKSSADISS